MLPPADALLLTSALAEVLPHSEELADSEAQAEPVGHAVLLTELLGGMLPDAALLQEAGELGLPERLAKADQEGLLLSMELPEAECRELPEGVAPLL